MCRCGCPSPLGCNTHVAKESLRARKREGKQARLRRLPQRGNDFTYCHVSIEQGAKEKTMNLNQGATASKEDSGTKPDGTLSGRWLVILRSAWIGLALVEFVLFIAGI